MDSNPYASPLATNTMTPPVPSDAESIRKQYISHEASVKSLGLLYLLGATLMVLVGSVMLGAITFGGAPGNADRGETFIMIIFSLIYLGLGILQGVTGYGLRKLQTWARYVATVFSALGLIAIPIGTLISIYFLYLLLSQKGTMVFSEEYKQIILETPHVRSKTSAAAWILLLLFIVVIIAAVAMVIGG